MLEESFVEEIKKERLTARLVDLLESDRDDENLEELIDTKIQLNFEIKKDERYWEQRARINWQQFGDKNTTFFHKQATQRRRRNLIWKLQFEDGKETEEVHEMEVIDRSYFQNLFSAGRRGNYEHLLIGIDRCIFEEDNSRLTARYTKEEIREALSELGPTKAPGEDGFPTLFYQKCWSIVGEDVSSFCLKHLNEAKVIANRLRIVIDKCINLAQSAFVSGRLISDNVLLAYEILHTFKQKKTGKKGYMVVKLDMSKAYDRVDWNFIATIMKCMGFNSGWVESLMKCVSTVSYSVVFNGHIGENLKPTRGLRQVDPLSPLLFLICGEGLSSLMRLAIQGNILRGVKASRSGPQVSHLLFADDSILFGEATEKGALSLKQILIEYENCSGQCVNYDKSAVFFSTNTQEGDKAVISRVLGVRSSNNPKRYLGLPNMVGRNKKISFQILKDKMKQRIDNWSARHLSQRGKEVFIKAILQAIPTYTMACFLIPKSLCVELEGIMARYWGKKNRDKKGIHWCTWKNLCSLKEDSGLGFRNLDKFNIALLAKQGWHLINFPNSLLSCVLKAKYYPNLDFIKAKLGNLPSLTWKSVWAAKRILEKGLCWRIGTGDHISIWGDLWIPGAENDRLQDETTNEDIKLVSDLIDANNRKWKSDLVLSTFNEDTAKKILQIPLSETIYEDFQVWRGESSGEYSVRSAYKLLQEANSELNRAEEKRLLTNIDRGHKQMKRSTRMSVYFDAAYDKRTSRSTSGLRRRTLPVGDASKKYSAGEGATEAKRTGSRRFKPTQILKKKCCRKGEG
ncbi:reverse transcriptase [Gossypium australe]|uniref:Reverse transcriptase n=1 Tax=Gossypium australe TaxID=47621 RepID=A0A5B6W6J1_9ROSI|nr:reverse transcriptase [Gossypium australe]